MPDIERLLLKHTPDFCFLLSFPDQYRLDTFPAVHILDCLVDLSVWILCDKTLQGKSTLTPEIYEGRKKLFSATIFPTKSSNTDLTLCGTEEP